MRPFQKLFIIFLLFSSTHLAPKNRGLKHIGGNCFINAVLQVLSHTKLIQYFDDNIDIRKPENKTQVHRAFRYRFYELIKALKKEIIPEKEKPSKLPNEYTENLSIDGETINHSHFLGLLKKLSMKTSWSDAPAFLTDLLYSLFERNDDPDTKTTIASIMKRFFWGNYESKNELYQYKYITYCYITNFEKKDKHQTFIDAEIDDTFKRRKDYGGTQKLASHLLVIRITREKDTIKKHGAQVLSFPEIVTLPTKQPTTYTLRSLTISNDGHSTAFIKDTNDSQWYYCNDSSVSKANDDFKTLQKKGTWNGFYPYLLIYETDNPYDDSKAEPSSLKKAIRSLRDKLLELGKKLQILST